jgi:hypothetical protein
MQIIRWIRLLLFALLLVAMPAASFAQLFVSVSFAPPALPIYEQPPCPGDGYLWTPGYWAYGPEGYFWVPGTWVQPPRVGLFWTPGYWAWQNSAYYWRTGYWGPVVGFYGGIPYGFGYPGFGYQVGRWDNGRFYYNRAANNVSVTRVRYVYNTTVIRHSRERWWQARPWPVSLVVEQPGRTSRPRPACRGGRMTIVVLRQTLLRADSCPQCRCQCCLAAAQRHLPGSRGHHRAPSPPLAHLAGSN